ncbi:hypothetical protein BD413DRAFT_467412, partial [Trametes elegans]
VQGNYNSAAARVLFIWDYLVTLDREVEFVWGQRFSAASALFVVNRYVNLLITILELVEQATFQTAEVYVSNVESSCVPIVRILQSLLIVTTFIVALFATLRVYATWSRDWRPALPILVLSLVTPAADIYLDVSSRPILAPQPSVGCAISTHVDRDTRSRQVTSLVIAERAATIAYDALVLVFTLLKTANAREIALSLHQHPNLPALLLRDGWSF